MLGSGTAPPTLAPPGTGAPGPPRASTATLAAGAWRALPAGEAERWTERLFDEGASLFQLPYWNAPLTALRLTPRHLVLDAAGEEAAYACVLTLGPPGLRIGLVQRGPVPLGGRRTDAAMLASLAGWARRHGYVFLRFTHHDPDVAALARALPAARDLDAFPFYREPDEELIVDQRGTDAELLARFQPIGRREILHAEKAGYELVRGERPEDLAAVWPLFERLGERKAFSFRPVASFMALMRLARPLRAASVYVARLGGRPIQAIFIVRSRDTAHFVSGALDVDALGDAPSPSAWLHWHAMREQAAEGAWRYDMGSRSGRVYAFKRKFHPVETRFPPAVTVVLDRFLFAAWSGVVKAVTGERRRRLKALLARLDRRTRGAEPA